MPKLASRHIHVTRDYSGMSDRAAREKAFWDEAYRVEGPAREKHLWSKFITEASYSEDLFGALLGEFVGQRILTLGGGVDTVGVSLSKNNNRVVSLDISPAAAQQTAESIASEGTGRALVAALGEARFFPGQRLPDAAQIPEHVRPHSSDEVAGPATWVSALSSRASTRRL